VLSIEKLRKERRKGKKMLSLRTTEGVETELNPEIIKEIEKILEDKEDQ